MKYMGSKRAMLANGFGEAILEQAAQSDRVVDLFAGSAAVSWFAAEHTGLPVMSCDLQAFSAVLAQAITGRTTEANAQRLQDGWLRRVRRAASKSSRRLLWSQAESTLTAEDVFSARDVCRNERGRGPLWNAYGGHYFSPQQALALDIALTYLPEDPGDRALCHAAIVVAAGYCAAAPGHTAQPFQPTATALPFIADSWRRDPLRKISEWLDGMAGRHASVKGRAIVGDAVEEATKVSARDLVIVDPPYSAVQYSRFYHVLETVARQSSLEVDGVGRYPPKAQRPSSAFSLRTQSADAIENLLGTLAENGACVLLTFPAGECSNGLSGGRVVELAREHFAVSAKTVLGRFSTLGGNNTLRASRHTSAELILLLSP